MLFIQFSSVALAISRSFAYWDSVQPCWSAEKTLRSVTKTVPKMDEELLNP